MGVLKSLFFKIPAWQIFLLIVIAIIAGVFFGSQFVIGKIPHGSLFLYMILFIIVISVNGNSIMNEGGLDLASFLHFGITVAFGLYAGLFVILVTTIIATYLAKTPTPIDFSLQKNPVKVWIQTIQLLVANIFFSAIISIFGINFLYAHMALIFLLGFTFGRLVRGTMLIVYARVPPMKVAIVTLVFYAINWYLVNLFGKGFIDFLKAL